MKKIISIIFYANCRNYKDEQNTKLRFQTESYAEVSYNVQYFCQIKGTFKQAYINIKLHPQDVSLSNWSMMYIELESSSQNKVYIHISSYHDFWSVTLPAYLEV